MNKEEFIKQIMEIDHITRETFDKTYLVIPCNCGAIYCKGYKCLEKDEIDEWLLLYIENLQKQAEQREHYKHLYSLIKKQKDDVVNRIKLLGKYDGTKCTRGFKMMTADFNDLLRMLGEIDE